MRTDYNTDTFDETASRTRRGFVADGGQRNDKEHRRMPVLFLVELLDCDRPDLWLHASVLPSAVRDMTPLASFRPFMVNDPEQMPRQSAEAHCVPRKIDANICSIVWWR